MRAFVIDLNTHRAVTVTNEYKTRRGMEAHALDHLPPGQYKLEVHNDWDTRYGEPDFEVTLYKRAPTRRNDG